RFSSSFCRASAIVVFPAAGSPVSQMQKPFVSFIRFFGTGRLLKRRFDLRAPRVSEPPAVAGGSSLVSVLLKQSNDQPPATAGGSDAVSHEPKRRRYSLEERNALTISA